jgi:ABC-type sulfate/molybdate transport systems ATPase subunit
VEAWNCELQTAKPVPDALTHVGLRSHQIAFHPAEGENIFSCWLMGTSEAPHEMTLYLRLHAAPAVGEFYHLQADVPRDLWRTLSLESQPWRIELDPERLLLLQG